MRDVRWQRHLPVALQHLVDTGVALEVQLEQIVNPPHHSGHHTLGKPQCRSRLGRFAGAHMRQRPLRARRIAVEHAFDQRFNRTARLLASRQARLDHLGIVEHQHIVRLQQARQIAEHAVHAGTRCAIKMQQAAGGARSGRLLGNQLGRQ